MKNLDEYRRICMVFFLIAISILCFKTAYAQSVVHSNPDTIILKHIASLRNDLTHIRMTSFQNILITDQYKTAGIIEELLNRAEMKIFDLLPPGKFEWSWTGFDQPKEMVAHAEELLNILAAGKDPFDGKYAEPGGYVVDHALIKKDGVTHLFYIRGTAVTNWPEYPLANFGHAVSKDLIHWKTEDPVLQCPVNGWDNYQVWAPHIIEHKGTYYMFYAGVNKNVCQGICLATSTDLYNWKRNDKNPLISSGKWGNWSTDKWSDCRDPMILNDGTRFYCYYTATRTNQDSGQMEYCMGISSSENLLDWKDEGFVRLEFSLATPPESPFVVKRDGTYYLVYTNYKYGITYATSKDPVKGWKELPADKMVLISGVSASEIYEDNGKWYLSYISHQKNGLHFFEITDLLWNKDGSISVGKVR
jgi:predicted GH43/DUF377 family glycosyl hydrolase